MFCSKIQVFNTDASITIASGYVHNVCRMCRYEWKRVVIKCVPRKWFPKNANKR